MRRPGTRNEQFIQRIPSDIIDRIRGAKLLIPVGDRMVTKKIGPTAQDIRLSLSTSDPKVAKERHAQVSAALAKHYAAARQGPRRLTPKETMALAGIAYRLWVDAFDDDPGPPGLWDRAVAADEEVIQGLPHRDRLRLTPAIPEEKRMRLLAALERRFGPVVDVCLDASDWSSMRTAALDFSCRSPRLCSRQPRLKPVRPRETTGRIRMLPGSLNGSLHGPTGMIERS